MKSVLPSFWVLFSLTMSATGLHAQDVRSEPLRGKVLLLENDRILEGEIDKIDNQYRIRRTIGELWLPADRAKRLCKDFAEAFSIMQAQANMKDPDERLRLARWCQVNGLRDQALAEAKAAFDMRPGHTETHQMVQMLQRFAISTNPAMATATQVGTRPATQVMAIKQTLDVSNESFAQFTTRVQPILLNTCITCHSQGRGGEFQLVRTSEGGFRVAAQKNLDVVLEFINLEKPVLSPLLIKAVVPHGGASQPAIKGRQTAAFQALQNWVDQTVQTNPHLREIRRADQPSPPPVFGASTSAKKDYFQDITGVGDPKPAIPATSLREGKQAPIVSRPPSPLPPTTTDKSPTLPTEAVTPMSPVPPALNANPASVAPPIGPRDPFDPAEFNRLPAPK